jgi:hypothetical protein
MEPTESPSEKLAKLLSERQLVTSMNEGEVLRLKSTASIMTAIEDNIAMNRQRLKDIDEAIFIAYQERLKEGTDGTA